MGPNTNRGYLPASVILLGVVSLLTDISAEMIFPLLPAFLASRFTGVPLVLGAMEGVADFVAAGCKWWSGQWADRAKRLRPMIFFGYTIASLARPLMAFVTRWWQPLLIRSMDRVGKGLRTSPRDALIAEWVPEVKRGRAFGFHRGMDNAGAAFGGLVAVGLVSLGISIQRIFLLAAIPGLVSVLMLFFVKEPAREPRERPEHAADLKPVPRRLFAYLGPVALFSLANSTDAFVLLKLTELGAAPPLLPIAWLLLQGVKAAISFPAGLVADRIGSAQVLVTGWFLYAISYAGLAIAATVPATLAVIAFYGLYHGFSEGAERALLSQLAPSESRGRAFGLYHALSGIGSLVAGLVFGWLWTQWGSKLAFLSAGATAALSAVLMVLLLPYARDRALRPAGP